MGQCHSTSNSSKVSECSVFSFLYKGLHVLRDDFAVDFLGHVELTK